MSHYAVCGLTFIWGTSYSDFTLRCLWPQGVSYVSCFGSLCVTELDACVTLHTHHAVESAMFLAFFTELNACVTLHERHVVFHAQWADLNFTHTMQCVMPSGLTGTCFETCPVAVGLLIPLGSDVVCLLTPAVFSCQEIIQRRGG
eukprot:TRINITY_DN5438_c0_g1_i1.p1 TRINITY_DN5438_c0_g1~~TRINITY_DN5438_c0_g1_i1.p1  ORF type:complete len:145 (-),score=12.78 TRINITY_DN5438_c0_g1_i1:126-560(-)